MCSGFLKRQQTMKESENNLKLVKPWDDSIREDHAAKVGGMRNLIEIEVETEDGYMFSYLVKRPNKNVLFAVQEAEQKKDLTLVQKLMLGCVLEGDREAYEHDGAIYMQLIKQIGELVSTANSRIKKK